MSSNKKHNQGIPRALADKSQQVFTEEKWTAIVAYCKVVQPLMKEVMDTVERLEEPLQAVLRTKEISDDAVARDVQNILAHQLVRLKGLSIPPATKHIHETLKHSIESYLDSAGFAVLALRGNGPAFTETNKALLEGSRLMRMAGKKIRQLNKNA